VKAIMAVYVFIPAMTTLIQQNQKHSNIYLSRYCQQQLSMRLQFNPMQNEDIYFKWINTGIPTIHPSFFIEVVIADEFPPFA